MNGGSVSRGYLAALYKQMKLLPHKANTKRADKTAVRVSQGCLLLRTSGAAKTGLLCLSTKGYIQLPCLLLE